MSIYNINGTGVSTAYNVNGNAVQSAYNVNGSKVFVANSLKVMTYNVGQYYIGDSHTIPNDKKTTYSALQSKIFTDNAPDICFMQEATTEFCQDGTVADAFLSAWFDNFQTTRGSVAYQAHKIASNGIQIDNYTVVPFVNAVGNYPGYETFNITVGGKQIFCVNTHMTTSQATQEAQCAEVLNAVSNKDYFIICGDFNTVIASLSDTDYTTCIKPFIDAGYSDANCGAFGIFPTYYATSDPEAEYKPATDHIIVSANIEILNAYVDTTKLTDEIDQKIDHVPLVAVLQIN